MNLKKMTALFLVLALGCAFAAAQEKIGLSPGLEVGFGDVSHEAALSITPNLVFENSYDNIDVYGEVDYTIEFTDPIGQFLYIEGEIGYNMGLGSASTLTFALNDNNTFQVAPANTAGHSGTIEPSVQYTHTLDLGDLYAKVGMPLGYMGGSYVGSYLTLGYAAPFGLGLELTGNYDIDPNSGYSGLGLLVSYEHEMFYGEVKIETDSELSSFIIKPEVDIFVDAWTFIVRAEIYQYGKAGSAFMPFIGAKYTF
jgi:hypothetical protein